MCIMHTQRNIVDEKQAENWASGWLCSQLLIFSEEETLIRDGKT